MSGVGHNNPPPFVAHDVDISDLYDEAKHFLDGAPVETQGQAEAVGTILDRVRKAWKAADEQRKVEKQPHDAAAQAVQDQWNPLLAKAKRLETVAKTVIGAWQVKVDAEQRAEAARLAQEAEAARIAAQELAQAQHGTGRLEDAEQAEAAIKAAYRLTKEAARADKAKPLISTGGRSIGLRTHWEAEITDRRAAINFYLKRSPDRFEALLQQLADEDARGTRGAVPGVLFHERKRAA
jgi:hypothetical protein